VYEEMMTWYVSRRVDLPLRDASQALDELVETAATDARAAVRLPGALAVRPIAALPGVDRRLRGSLAIGGLGGPVPVELELAAWSRDESEVALRPAVRRPIFRSEHYFTAAVEGLRSLDDALVAAAHDDRNEQPVEVRRAS
jgi:hypothetical protein